MRHQILPLIFTLAFATPYVVEGADPLASADNLELVNVAAKSVEYKGKSAINLVGTRQMAPRGRAGGQPRQPGGQPGRAGGQGGPGARGGRAGGQGAGQRGPGMARAEALAIVKDTNFTNGTIELELVGRPNASAGANARGFVGVAFHVEQSEPIAYDCFYLRPTNGRADDQLRRNHSCQYMSHPDFPFNLLRRETPGVYESYVDLVSGDWTQVKIEVEGEKARLYVNGADQPCLIVNDLKRAGKTGSIALWMEQSTDAYFRNLVVTSAD